MRTYMAQIALELPANKDAPAVARRAVKDAAASLMSEDDCWRAQLIVTELVSNAVVHGPGGPVSLNLELGGHGLRGQVADPGPPIRKNGLVRRRAVDEGGRGLFLVDALSDEWGLSEDRSCVWFEVVAA